VVTPYFFILRESNHKLM